MKLIDCDRRLFSMGFFIDNMARIITQPEDQVQPLRVSPESLRLPSIAVIKALTLDRPLSMKTANGVCPLLQNVCLQPSTISLLAMRKQLDRGVASISLDYPQALPNFSIISHQAIAFSSGLDMKNLFLFQNPSQQPGCIAQQLPCCEVRATCSFASC